MSAILNKISENVAGRHLLPFYESRLRGRNTFRYRNEFDANQWRTPEAIESLQWDKVRSLLSHAYETTDYYRSVFDELNLRPEDITDKAALSRLPILEKFMVRQHRDQMISSSFSPTDLIRSATGGSTGEPLQFYYNRDSYERRIAAAMRGDSWAGWRLCGPEFYVWGASLMPERGAIRIKKQMHHALLRRTIVSSFDLSAKRIEATVKEYNRSPPRVVVGYANALYEFARYIKQTGLQVRPPEGVISSAERLYDYQRTEIESAFGAPVFNRYGCREVMMIAAECDHHNGLHITADNVFVEVVRDGKLCRPGETGEILLTDLHNYGMPLIRYKVGDIGSWKEGNCACGRGLPLLNVVDGRVLDVISTPDGHVISGEYFPHLMKDFPEIIRYQIIQERRDALTVLITLKENFPDQRERLLKSVISQAVGDAVKVTWEIGMDVIIERTQKFRPVISKVPVDFLSATDKE